MKAKLYVPRAPIKSGSHNAQYSNEHGYHWPMDEKFRLLKRHSHCLRIHLEQIEGEQVIICVPRERFAGFFQELKSKSPTA